MFTRGDVNRGRWLEALGRLLAERHELHEHGRGEGDETEDGELAHLVRRGERALGEERGASAPAAVPSEADAAEHGPGARAGVEG